MSGHWADRAATLVGVHQPGRSLLHRTPAGVKFAGLLLTLAVLLWWRAPIVVAVGFLIAVLALVSTGVRWRVIARPMALVALVLLALGVAQWVLVGPGAALTGVARMGACIALAWAVSLTTPVSEMLALFVAILQPLRPIGVDPDRVGLTMMLAIRSIPLIMAAVRDADQARMARGSRPSVRALVVPSVVRTVQIADQVGDALVARGAAITPAPADDPFQDPQRD